MWVLSVVMIVAGDKLVVIVAVKPVLLQILKVDKFEPRSFCTTSRKTALSDGPIITEGSIDLEYGNPPDAVLPTLKLSSLE